MNGDLPGACGKLGNWGIRSGCVRREEQMGLMMVRRLNFLVHHPIKVTYYAQHLYNMNCIASAEQNVGR